MINFSRFREFGFRSYIRKSLKINGFKNIRIGKRVFIGYKSWIEAVPLTGGSCELKIGDGTCIGNFNHIFATGSIIIGENVLTADRVYISDNLHSYSNPFVPIMNQPIKQIKHVYIGDGCWIGENVCIIGSSVGKNCVIGANAVVTRDIPDYSVAVGIPAKIIKRYNINTSKWEITDGSGNFINHYQD